VGRSPQRELIELRKAKGGESLEAAHVGGTRIYPRSFKKNRFYKADDDIL